MSFKRDLASIVGASYVSEDPEQLDRHRRDESLSRGVRPSHVVRPADADQVREVIRLANRRRFPVIPVSSGVHCNGITLPTQGGVILNLERMQRIIEVDVRNRRAMIEPGVKWGQLQDHLRSQDMAAMNPLLPHPEQSVVTSYLERQPLIIPKFEYAEPITTLEVVLPTGDLLRTGSAASPGAPFETVADMVCPYGPGLDFYRLFQGAQGTLGVVTWMNVKIEYFSVQRKTFFLSCDRLSDLLALVHEAQRWMIGNECFILNRPDMAALVSNGQKGELSRIAQHLSLWHGLIQIAGARRRAEERIRYQEEAFRQICRHYPVQVEDSLPGAADPSAELASRLQGPWPAELPFWKTIRAGGCLDLAFHSTFARLPEVLDDLESALTGSNCASDEYGIYIQPLENGRAYYCRLHLYYDPEDKDGLAALAEVTEGLNRRLLLAGSLFNTPYGSQSPLVYDHAGMYTETLKQVKRIFDPKGILNPGRLCF